LNQLNDQLGSVSGVNLDEETTNLMNYQRAYEAAARVVSTVDELTQSVLDMGSGVTAAP
jgi:flagellar hook-associated protein 1 FlgK